ncbi:MAG: Uma2 family endonuclease [Pirellulaceae bacterium]|nr:Uma2 family endonuclease [Planctomycetales bacterium]
MPILVCDTRVEQQLLAERAASGADRYDEVWEGIYMMAPMPNDEHQQIVSRLDAILQLTLDWSGLAHVRPGVNVSDRKEDWTSNYRVPDIAVFLRDGSAQNCDSFWYGGPDFAVEILSPGEVIENKIEFYAKVGVRELLIINRQPWVIELRRLESGMITAVSHSKIDGEVSHCQTIPFRFSLRTGSHRPAIRVEHESGQSWDV